MYLFISEKMIKRSKSLECINDKEEYNPFIPNKMNNPYEKPFYMKNGTFIDLINTKKRSIFTRIKGRETIINRISWHEELKNQHIKNKIKDIVLVGLVRKKFPTTTTMKDVIEAYVNKESLRPKLEDDLLEFYKCLATDNLEKDGWLVTNRKSARELAAAEVDFSCDVPKIQKFYILMNILKLKKEGKIIGLH